MYKKIYKSMCSVILFTLVLSSLFIILVSYSLTSTYMQDKLEEEALAAAEIINNEDSLYSLPPDYFSFFNSRIYIFSKEGSMIYGDNSKDIKAPKTMGFIPGKGYCITLDNGNIMFMESEHTRLNTTLLIMISTAPVILVLIYFLAIAIAKALTKNIISPLKNIYSYEQDSIYEELEPFIKRIATQGKEIKRQENKVKEQKSRLQAISENMSEGLVVIGKDKKILSVNRSVLELFHVLEEDIKHQDFTMLTRDKKLYEHLEKALCGKKDYTTFEKNSTTYQVFYSPVYEKNMVSGVIILLIDVSEKVRAEEIRREFSANVSHELKTPLTTIHGYSQIITQGIAREEDILNFAAKIEQESFRMINLIDDIIKLSRLDEEAEAPEKEKIDLKTLALDVSAKLSAKAEKREIEVSVLGEETEVLANKIQITEMIYNLLENAIKYNIPQGRVVLEITKQGFTVSDTGIGIPEEYKERIFERFFRVDKSHSKSITGTGLGLSIVKHAAISNDADITVSSLNPRGTIFTVTFRNI